MQTRALLLRPDQEPREVPRDEWARLACGEQGLLWLDVEYASDEELNSAICALGIDPRIAADADHMHRRAGVRVYRNQYLVSVLSVDVRETSVRPHISVVSVDFLVGRNLLLSMHRLALPFRTALEERTLNNPYLGQFEASYLLYVILDTIVGHYAREFDEVEDRVERLEEQFLHSPSRRGLDHATEMKRHILLLRRLIAPHREAFGILASADIPIVEEENATVHFRDLLVHLDDFLERLDHARDVLTGAYNLYVSNIEDRTNQQLRVLTFLSAVLLPMTVVTGIFGTNFAIGEYRHWQPFYVMLIGMGLLALGMLAFFRWRRWL